MLQEGHGWITKAFTAASFNKTLIACLKHILSSWREAVWKKVSRKRNAQASREKAFSLLTPLVPKLHWLSRLDFLRIPKNQIMITELALTLKFVCNEICLQKIFWLYSCCHQCVGCLLRRRWCLDRGCLQDGQDFFLQERYPSTVRSTKGSSRSWCGSQWCQSKNADWSHWWLLMLVRTLRYWYGMVQNFSQTAEVYTFCHTRHFLFDLSP